MGVVTKKSTFEAAISSLEQYYFENAKNVRFLKDSSNLMPYLIVRNWYIQVYAFSCISGPKVVVNVRLMTGPLIDDNFEGDSFSALSLIIISQRSFAEDDNLTLTKFKTFQVRLLKASIFSKSPSRFNSTGR
jgi:hypothetical protein